MLVIAKRRLQLFRDLRRVSLNTAYSNLLYTLKEVIFDQNVF